MNAKRIRCLFCGGKHTESECISPTAYEHRAKMKLSLRVVELKSAMQEFVEEYEPGSCSSCKNWNETFKKLLEAK